MSADERLDGEDVDLVARHCGAGHPVQLPAALHDSVGSRFEDALRQPAPVGDTPERPPRRKRPRPTPSRPRPSRARRPPVVRDSSSEHSSEAGPMNLFNDHSGGMGGGNSGGGGGGEGGMGVVPAKGVGVTTTEGVAVVAMTAVAAKVSGVALAVTALERPPGAPP
ncbi:hypothetical protein BU14_0238s0001 [Porphyra umbilicalis]|uniref:Uncharacterized protein n=1 Tax=Porphyra umbilicalis TaxID=2786 RepID=A0A1X6P3G1_PORUM|nr:hypothetical protein BU14_0238s0001 [Porphyra umbilicalis]|eukprot:OSX75378.1 hypothetical protein BU14_0238s0001 [Porphyra umbilicalis]